MGGLVTTRAIRLATRSPAKSVTEQAGWLMVLNVLSSAMAGTAIPLTGTTATRKIFVPGWQAEKTPAEGCGRRRVVLHRLVLEPIETRSCGFSGLRRIRSA